MGKGKTMNKKFQEAKKLANEVKRESGADCGVECDRRGYFSVIEIDRYNQDELFLYRTDK